MLHKYLNLVNLFFLQWSMNHTQQNYSNRHINCKFAM